MATSTRTARHTLRDRATGRFVKAFHLHYETDERAFDHTLPARGIERIGAVAMEAANRGTVWNIKVTDKDGTDVTFDFACFQD
ncbi:hypothetical protein H1V43_32190 [Streptomyces sp. PSKA54]|uniref:Uncharacterized protein n=1 Tax=Streptomyces himalayensis subsp. aureolus TaxID=2758039 RepID=A0A7W2D6Z7_9ACTN|nr:hypothetical protein [Streptomyces himalayensis]MBA4865925.1 hypothetical protein [Streptomyces himalayensis subsp. aureolus]